MDRSCDAAILGCDEGAIGLLALISTDAVAIAATNDVPTTDDVPVVDAVLTVNDGTVAAAAAAAE